jgi:hypothetical protein
VANVLQFHLGSRTELHYYPRLHASNSFEIVADIFGFDLAVD